MAWRYDLETVSFINLETGDRLTASEAEDLVDEIIESAKDDADDIINNTLDVEDPDVEEFERQLAGLVSDLFIILAILGGGLAIYSLLRREVERKLERQYVYLEPFARQVYADTVSLGSARNRAHMYANSSRGAYWLTRDEAERQRGSVEEKWLVIGDEHTCSPCFSAGGMGWQTIGTFGQPGSGIVTLSPLTVCQGLTSCRCKKSYR